MFRIIVVSKVILLALILGITLSQAFSRVIEENGKTYIVDLMVNAGMSPRRYRLDLSPTAFNTA
jgi:hypothetical protein